MSTIDERTGFGILEGAGTYYNNAALGTASSFNPAAPTAALTIGAASNGTSLLTGQVYQALVYAANHNATTRAAVLAFLNAKAGVTFPAA